MPLPSRANKNLSMSANNEDNASEGLIDKGFAASCSDSVYKAFCSCGDWLGDWFRVGGATLNVQFLHELLKVPRFEWGVESNAESSKSRILHLSALLFFLHLHLLQPTQVVEDSINGG